MNEKASFHPASPILNFCPPSLPAKWYYEADHFTRETAAIHAKNWIYVGRVNDLSPLTVKRVEIAGQNLILVKSDDGIIRCFHNTCRHRGSELCVEHTTRLKAKLITCPYHEWAYDLTGRLVRTPHVTDAPGFVKSENGLFTAQVKTWNGFIFVCLADDAPDFSKVVDMGVDVFKNWPMEELVTGHRLVKTMNCNWKVFWENYNECLHCPGIHESLCEMVPIYRQGVMSASEAPGWSPDAAPKPVLKEGARSWTLNGQPCGEEFPNLTRAQREAGFLFATLMPTMYIVAHVDYVRAVSLRPLGPETTELTAEWLFPAKTLSAPGFNLANVTDFATRVMLEDGAACELNQRGLRSSKFEHGTLMPQEFDVFNFHQWVRRHLGEPLSIAEEA
jgi:Rieske 2Fe-2S family protein